MSAMELLSSLVPTTVPDTSQVLSKCIVTGLLGPANSFKPFASILLCWVFAIPAFCVLNIFSSGFFFKGPLSSFLFFFVIFFDFLSWAHVSPPDVLPSFPPHSFFEAILSLSFLNAWQLLVIAIVCHRAHIYHLIFLSLSCMQRFFAFAFLMIHLWTSGVFPGPTLFRSVTWGVGVVRAMFPLDRNFPSDPGFTREPNQPSLLSLGKSGQVWQPRVAGLPRRLHDLIFIYSFVAWMMGEEAYVSVSGGREKVERQSVCSQPHKDEVWAVWRRLLQAAEDRALLPRALMLTYETTTWQRGQELLPTPARSRGWKEHSPALASCQLKS